MAGSVPFKTARMPIRAGNQKIGHESDGALPRPPKIKFIIIYVAHN